MQSSTTKSSAQINTYSLINAKTHLVSQTVQQRLNQHNYGPYSANILQLDCESKLHLLLLNVPSLQP